MAEMSESEGENMEEPKKSSFKESFKEGIEETARNIGHTVSEVGGKIEHKLAETGSEAAEAIRKEAKEGFHAKEIISDTASAIGKAHERYKEYQKESKEERLLKLQEQRQRLAEKNMLLKIAKEENKIGLKYKTHAPGESKGHPGEFAYSQVGHIDLGVKSENIGLGVGVSKPAFNMGLSGGTSHGLSVGNPKPLGFTGPKSQSSGFAVKSPSFTKFTGKKKGGKWF